MIYSMLNKSIIASFFAISFSQAMEVEKITTLRINPNDIDATDTIACKSGIARGFSPFKIINTETLKGMGNQDIQELVLSPEIMPSDHHEIKFLFAKEVIETILTHFPNLTHLDLSNNNISPMAMEYLLDQLKTNTKIATLKLSNTGLCKAGPLFRTMIDFPKEPEAYEPTTPKKIIIAENDPAMDVKNSEPSKQEYREDDDFMTLMQAQTNPEKLPIFHLNGSISTVNSDANFLWNLLTENTNLKVLDFSNNAIEDKHLETISSGFTCNKTVQTLNLDGNRITETGAATFKQLLNDQKNPLVLLIGNQKTGEEDFKNDECIIF